MHESRRALYLLTLLCACGPSEALQLKLSAAGSDAGSLVVSTRDAGRRQEECARVTLETSGSCEIALPDAEWVERLDCQALIRFGLQPIACAEPDGWIVQDDTLKLLGTSCRQVQAQPGQGLEVIVACAPF